jgi:hypothetical protein
LKIEQALTSPLAGLPVFGKTMGRPGAASKFNPWNPLPSKDKVQVSTRSSPDSWLRPDDHQSFKEPVAVSES